MSGGRYEYCYARVENMAMNMWGKETVPLRKAFALHLLKVAKAMRDVEWEDSGDGAVWEASVRDVLSPGAEVEAATETIQQAIASANEAMRRLKDRP